MELEKEWQSQMSPAVCSIPLISPIGMPSPLHTADQLPPLYLQSVLMCVHRHVCLCAC